MVSTITGVMIAATTVTGRIVTTEKKEHLTGGNGQSHLPAAPNTMIVAQGLRLQEGGIMMRESLQGTMIIGGGVMMMTAEPLITIMTAAGTIMTGDATNAVADAMTRTIGTTIGR